MFDSAGICIFTSFAWTLDDVAPQIDAACEGDWSVDRLLEVGERIWNMERQYNLGVPASPARMTTCRKRLLKDAAKTGPAKGLTNQLDKMLPEYYQVRGWDPGWRADQRDLGALEHLIAQERGRPRHERAPPRGALHLPNTSKPPVGAQSECKSDAEGSA